MRLGKTTPALLCIVAAAALGLSRPGGDQSATLCHRALGITCDITRNQCVGNRPIDYLYFDRRAFLSEPFLSPEPPSAPRGEIPLDHRACHRLGTQA